MELWRPTKYGPHRRELEWLNFCVGSHDMVCGCDDPAAHLMILLAKKSGYYQISKENIEKATKCLTTGETTATTGEEEEDLGFDAGDLEALFADHEEDATG